jgi:hypothetical protein
LRTYVRVLKTLRRPLGKRHVGNCGLLDECRGNDGV